MSVREYALFTQASLCDNKHDPYSSEATRPQSERKESSLQLSMQKTPGKDYIWPVRFV